LIEKPARLEEDVDAVFLDWQELSKIYRLGLSELPHLEKYRDLFIIGCLTGFRFGDYSKLNLEEYRDGMLQVIQKKTLASVVVPLRPEAKSLLVDKYKLRLPKISHAKFNKYIKEIVKLAGIFEPFKSHPQERK
jgi:integrase